MPSRNGEQNQALSWQLSVKNLHSNQMLLLIERKFWGVIPWKRPSSAKGYAQAVNSTWEDYKKETGNSRASRSSFSSSVDFIGWYLSKAPSARIQPQEVDKLYLAYHEGYGGYKRETYKGKSWLIDTARKVKFNSLKYKRQLNSCPLKQKRSWWNIFN